MSEKIGAYEKLDELGRGAFGRVYKGYDPVANQYVAIKVLSEAEPEMLALFRQELATTANLNHNNIVRLYTHGVHNGDPYLILELLEGHNLQQIIEENKRPLSVLEKVDIMFQVAEGLHYAHQKGVVHRDIKPANIMLLPSGQVKIMDFGIARMTGQKSRRTEQGRVVGSILYMAPEQLRGGPADTATDIFSFGVTFYELLTGKNPFYAESAGAAIYNITSVDPPPVRETVPDCPRELDVLIHRTLSKDRILRYQRLNSIISALQPILNELRQGEASRIVANAQSQFDLEQWEQAADLAEAALKLDPGNRTARQIQIDSNDEIFEKAKRERVAGLLEQGDRFAAEQAFNDAVNSYEAARRLDPADPVIQSRLEQTRRAQEAFRVASRCVAEARTYLGLESLQLALELVRKALAAISDYAPAKELETEVLARIAAAERRRLEREILDKAQQLRSAGEYSSAIDHLSSEAASKLGSSKIAELRERVEAEWQNEQRLRQVREFEALLQSGEKRLGENDLPGTEHLLLDVEERFAELAKLSDRFRLLRERSAARRRAEAIASARQEILDLCAAKQTAAAHAALDRARAALPCEPAIESLRPHLEQLEREQRRIADVDEVTARVQRCLDDGKLEDAIRILASSTTRALEHPVFGDWHSQLVAQQETMRQREEVRGAIERGRQLLNDRQLEQALRWLDPYCQKFPSDPSLLILRQEAQRGWDAEREKREVDEHIERIHALQGEDRYLTGLNLTQATLKLYPSNARLKELESSLQRWVAEQQDRKTVASLDEQIQQLLAAKNFGAAEVALDSARRRFPAEVKFDRLAEALKDAQRRYRLQQLCADAQTHISNDRVQDAFRLLDSVATDFASEPLWNDCWRKAQERLTYLDQLSSAQLLMETKRYSQAEDVLRPLAPGAPDSRAVDLLGEAARLRKQEEEDRDADQRAAEEKKAVSKALKESDAHAAKRNHDAALKCLAPAFQKYPNNPDLIARQKRLLATKRQQIQEDIQDLIEATKWDEALESIGKLRSEFPNDTAMIPYEAKALELRRQFLESAAAKVRDMLADKSVDEAKILFERNLGRYPEERISREISVEIATAEKRVGLIADRIKQARQEEQRGDFSAAVSTLQKASKEHRDDLDLRAELSRMQLAARFAEVRKLLGRGKWEDALRQLDEIRAERGASLPEFPALQQEIEGLRQREIRRCLEEAYKCLQAGKPGEAEKILRKQLAAFSAEPAVAALAEAIRTYKPPAKLVEKAVVVPGDVWWKSRKAAGLAASMLAVLAFTVYLFRGGTAPTPPLPDPAELRFKFQPGSVLEPQRITFRGAPDVAAPEVKDSWIKVSRSPRQGKDSEFLVEVRPEGLGPGLHAGIVQFGKSGRVSVALSIPQSPQYCEFSATTVTLTADAHADRLTVICPAGVQVPAPEFKAAWLSVTRRAAGSGKSEFLLDASAKDLPEGGSARLVFGDQGQVEVVVPKAGRAAVQPGSLAFPDRTGSMRPQTLTVTGPNLPSSLNTPLWLKAQATQRQKGRVDFLITPLTDSLSAGANMSDRLSVGEIRVPVSLKMPATTIEPAELNFGPGGNLSAVVTVSSPSRITKPAGAPSWLAVRPEQEATAGRARYTIAVLPDRAPGVKTTIELRFTSDKSLRVNYTPPAAKEATPVELRLSPSTIELTWTRGDRATDSKSFVASGPAEIPTPTNVPDWLAINRASTSNGLQFTVQTQPDKFDNDVFKDIYPAELSFPQRKSVHIAVHIKLRAVARAAESGTATFSGSLGPGETLFARGKDVKSTRQPFARLPLMPVRVTSKPDGIQVLQEPSVSNNFELRLQNTTSQPIGPIDLGWVAVK